jgi:hypothetical protein
MKTVLTKRLLGFLIKRGYKYCLSQTTSSGGMIASNKAKAIILRPVKKHPLLGKLPNPFQAYYDIFCEPFQMASEIIDASVFVELSIKEYENFNKGFSQYVQPTTQEFTVTN